eukprot:TRINITY_DN3787_c0_g1_i1.p1 TRINITY_DN3787_c0_g1~~TRINITY_DN3787_c0_g1_i1.p1  ORF type:complete len:496 (-),score=68.84 TRINITY_DN3787_c0_g1_i1:172-1659(-)
MMMPWDELSLEQECVQPQQGSACFLPAIQHKTGVKTKQKLAAAAPVAAPLPHILPAPPLAAPVSPPSVRFSTGTTVAKPVGQKAQVIITQRAAPVSPPHPPKPSAAPRARQFVVMPAAPSSPLPHKMPCPPSAGSSASPRRIVRAPVQHRRVQPSPVTSFVPRPLEKLYPGLSLLYDATPATLSGNKLVFETSWTISLPKATRVHKALAIGATLIHYTKAQAFFAEAAHALSAKRALADDFSGRSLFNQLAAFQVFPPNTSMADPVARHLFMACREYKRSLQQLAGNYFDKQAELFAASRRAAQCHATPRMQLALDLLLPRSELPQALKLTLREFQITGLMTMNKFLAAHEAAFRDYSTRPAHCTPQQLGNPGVPARVWQLTRQWKANTLVLFEQYSRSVEDEFADAKLVLSTSVAPVSVPPQSHVPGFVQKAFLLWRKAAIELVADYEGELIEEYHDAASAVKAMVNPPVRACLRAVSVLDSQRTPILYQLAFH